MDDWNAQAEREQERYREGETRLPDADDPDVRQRQLTRMGNAAYGAGLALLMAGRSDEAGEWLARAAERYRESFADAPPGSWGRPIGAMKARLLAGDWKAARDEARFALDAITGFSSAPLKLASHAGLALSLGSLLIIAYIVYAWLAGESIQGWTSLMLVVVILGAVQMFVLALMGQYIGRLYNQSKQRPLYIVQEIAGGGPPDDRARLGYVAEPIANSDSPGGKGTRPISARSAAKPRSKA